MQIKVQPSLDLSAGAVDDISGNTDDNGNMDGGNAGFLQVLVSLLFANLIYFTIELLNNL